MNLAASASLPSREILRTGVVDVCLGENTRENPEGVALRPYVDEMTRTMKRTLNRRKAVHPPTPAPTGAQGFLAPNLAQAAAPVTDDDLPDDFRKALEEAVKD
jgi:hypothetical protein